MTGVGGTGNGRGSGKLLRKREGMRWRAQRLPRNAGPPPQCRPSPAMQIKYRQRWAALFLDWLNWASQLKVKVLSSNFVGLSELSLHFHSPLWTGPGPKGLWTKGPKDGTKGPVDQRTKRPEDLQATGPGEQQKRPIQEYVFVMLFLLLFILSFYLFLGVF